MTENKWHVGQKVWISGGYKSDRKGEFEIVKVGRKYAYVDLGWREPKAFNMTTGSARTADPNYTSNAPQRMQTLAEHIAEKRRRFVLTRLRERHDLAYASVASVTFRGDEQRHSTDLLERVLALLDTETPTAGD